MTEIKPEALWPQLMARLRAFPHSELLAFDFEGVGIAIHKELAKRAARIEELTTAPAEPTAEMERLKARNRNMRRALRELNKLQQARAETIRAISHVPFAQRQDYLLEAKGKLGQRVTELNRALGNDTKTWKDWPELMAQVFQLRGAARVEKLNNGEE
jgi:hypothetical protein